MQITSGLSTAVANRAKDGDAMNAHVEKFNLPVEVVSVADDGSAKVRPLVSLGNLSNHEEYQARLQMDRLTMARAGRVAPKDFTFYYRRGLRKSGTVLLHACHLKEDGDLWFKRMDVLKERPTDFEVKVWHAASLSVLPPTDSDSKMTDEAIVVLNDQTVAVANLTRALEPVMYSLEEPRLMGDVGVIFKGPSPSGEIHYHIVMAPKGSESEDVARDLLFSCPKPYIRYARETGAWTCTPMIRAEIHPERKSRFAALAANYGYKSDEKSLLTTLGSATFSILDEEWMLFDATPYDLTPELHDLLSGNPQEEENYREELELQYSIF